MISTYPTVGVLDDYFLGKLVTVAESLVEYSRVPNINYKNTAIVILKFLVKHSNPVFLLKNKVAEKLSALKWQTLNEKVAADKYFFHAKKKTKPPETASEHSTRIRLEV